MVSYSLARCTRLHDVKSIVFIKYSVCIVINILNFLNYVLPPN